MSIPSDHTPFFLLAGGANDGWSNDDEATATCFCGAVQLKFTIAQTQYTHICHCSDCRKITASMHATNFVLPDNHITFLRGESNLTTFAQSKTIVTGNTMTNHFCKTCGTLMKRVSSGLPGMSVLRTGTVDDFGLHETKLKPTIEQFTKNRVGWLKGSGEAGVRQVEGYAFA